MPDFQILKTPMGGYVVLAPRREKRPDESKEFTPICPFCSGNEGKEKELFRIGGKEGDGDWKVRVLPNKFPFAQHHEVIVHSPDHHKNFDELPLEQVEIIFETFQQRFNTHKNQGTVFIFSNHGELGGESLPHPHSQLTVFSEGIQFEVPHLGDVLSHNIPDSLQTEGFTLFCPFTSQWPDEVWIAPKEKNRSFGQISKKDRDELSFILQRLIQIFTVKHGHEFPFNFYIFPKENWYLRFIPREKKLGGVEIVSNIFVNTGDPKETMKFIKENF